MLHNLKPIYGNKLGATDGDIGHVKDFYFDDQTWVIRYVVADTGSWLTGREVLLSPHVFGRWDGAAKTLPVNLKRKQIENSPSPEAHQPVSRQYEIEFYRYYGLPAYWEGTDMWGLGAYPIMIPPQADGASDRRKLHHRSDKHLQSSHAVTGYSIQATDGEIGHVTGFLIDDQSWAIRKLVVETGHWYSGKEVLIPTEKVERISFEDSKVFVRLSQNEIRHAAENTVT